MKRFIDENGIFEIKIPDTWKYSLKNEKVHTFQEYEIWKHDTFQLSIRKPATEEKRNFLKIIEKLPVTKINGVLYYSYPDFVKNKFITKTWTTLLQNKIVLFTLTYCIKKDTKLDKRTVAQNLKVVRKIISEFRLIENTKSEDEINSYRFDMFIQGVGATAYMLIKAIKSQSFVEATCLLASQIDALLRTGIILQKQILNKNSIIEKKWIYQGLRDKVKLEKDIYKEAKRLNIINENIFNNLCKFYDDRNRVIHRFIISEITVAEVEEIAYRYYQMQQKINKIVYDIESKQIKLNIGMTKRGDLDEYNHKNRIKGKIGKLNYFEEKE